MGRLIAPKTLKKCSCNRVCARLTTGLVTWMGKARSARKKLNKTVLSFQPAFSPFLIKITFQGYYKLGASWEGDKTENKGCVLV